MDYCVVICGKGDGLSREEAERIASALDIDNPVHVTVISSDNLLNPVQVVNSLLFKESP